MKYLQYYYVALSLSNGLMATRIFFFLFWPIPLGDTTADHLVLIWNTSRQLDVLSRDTLTYEPPTLQSMGNQSTHWEDGENGI